MEMRYVSRFHPDYPEKLSMIPQPPAGIYVKGRLPDPGLPTVAIIGSRLCSGYGRECAREFGQALGLAGVQVVSGLAKGVDGIAQESACLAGGTSFGILGCGTDVVYPARNKSIYDLVLENGGLISEYPPESPPRPAYFAERNRIISALCDILLVVEAGAMSGTQITVRHALDQGKDIYAIPGRIHDPCSEGCNRMISQGAGIALDPDILLEALGIYKKKEIRAKAGSRAGEGDKKRDAPAKEHPLNKQEKKVYEELDCYPRGLDELAFRCDMNINELSGILFNLLMKGYVREVGKNCYSRL